MSSYQIINEKLGQAGLHYEEEQLGKLDIIGYMVLEAAGALHPLLDMPLQSHFRPDFNNVGFQEGIRCSALEFGLKCVVDGPSISREEGISFNRIVSVIENRFLNAVPYYDDHRFGTLYGVILPDEEIKKAIQSSSLFVAAGDLSELNLESLLLLRRKLGLYKIADDKLSILVDRLVDKVNTNLSERFDQSAVQQALVQVDRTFEARLAIAREEYKFNQLLHDLNDKLNELIKKGAIAENIDSTGTVVEVVCDSNYLNVAPIAQSLSTALVRARNDFFNNPISQESFERFQESCINAIDQAKNEFANYRGQANWYNELNFVLKALITSIKVIAGVLAGITIIPAVLTEIYAEQGYLGTFFNNKTSSSKKLATFEQGVCAEDGIFEQLSETLPSLGMGY